MSESHTIYDAKWNISVWYVHWVGWRWYWKCNSINSKINLMKQKITNKCIEKINNFKINIPEQMRNYMAPVKLHIEDNAIYCG